MQTPKMEDMEDESEKLYRRLGFYRGQSRSRSCTPSALSSSYSMSSSTKLRTPIFLNTAVAMFHARGSYSAAESGFQSPTGETLQTPTPVAKESGSQLQRDVHTNHMRIRRVSILDSEENRKHSTRRIPPWCPFGALYDRTRLWTQKLSSSLSSFPRD